MSSELDDIKATIRALLISDPRDKYTLNDLYYQYKDTEGEELPFRKFNCRSTFDFIKMMPDTVKLLNPHDRNSQIKPIVTEESAHVFKLVNEQNASKKRNLSKFQPKFDQRRFNYNRHLPPGPRYYSINRPDTRSRPSFSNVNGRQRLNYNDDEVIVINSDESVIEISDDEEFKPSNRSASVSVSGLKMNGAREQSSTDFYKLRSLFFEPENAGGIWLTKLADAYRMKFSHPLSPEEYGYSTITDMVKNLPHVFYMKPYRMEGDYLLLDAEKHSQPIENSNTEERTREIPSLLIEKLKKVLQREMVIHSADLPSAYVRMYGESLRPEEYGFRNMDSFLQYVQDLLENTTTFCREAEKVTSLPGEVTYDPIPSEVCNADVKLESDPFIDALKEGNTFEVNLGETYSPAKFYITHINRLQLLSSMMADLNYYYGRNEAKYEVLVPLVTRNLLCACLYSVNNEWHRVRVISVSATSKTVKVFFIDYGTIQTVDVRKLRYLHKDFTKYPPLCICAKLSGIRPKDGDTYDDSVNHQFYELCGEYDLEVKIIRIYATCLEVQLYLLKGEDKISVGEELISRGLVMSKSGGPSSPIRFAKSPDAEKSLDEDDVPEVRNKNSIAFFNKLMADTSLKEKMKSEMEGSNTMGTQPNNELDENAEGTIELEHSQLPPGFLPASQPHVTRTRPYSNQNFLSSTPPTMSYLLPATSTYGQLRGPTYPYQVGGTPLTPGIPFQTNPLCQQVPMLPSVPYGSYLQNLSPIMSHYPYSAQLGTHLLQPPPGMNIRHLMRPVSTAPPPTVPVERNYYSSEFTGHPQNSSTSTSVDVLSKSLSNLECAVSSASQRSVQSASLNSARHSPNLSGDHSSYSKTEKSNQEETAALIAKTTQEETSLDEDLKFLRVQQDVNKYLMLSEDCVSEFIPKTKSAVFDSKVSTSYISSDDLFVDGLPGASLNEKISGDHVPNSESNGFCNSERSQSASPIKKTFGKNFGSIRDFVLKNTQNIPNQ